MGLKSVLIVFGSGFGEEPFLRKVSPDKIHIKLLSDIYSDS